MPTSGRIYSDMDRAVPDGDAQAQDSSQSRQSHKRKRESPGVNGRSTRQAPAPEPQQRATEANMGQQHPYYSQSNGTEDFSSIQQQVARHVANHNASSSTAAAALAASIPQLTVPQPTELSFPSTNSGNEEDRPVDSSFDIGQENTQAQSDGGSYNHYGGSNGDQTQNTGANTAGKPAVGTEEWHKVRKDNHKEVERRRRETINEGINELAKIVPGCDKNKGAILQCAVKYILQLKENETRNIEKWTLEKMLTDQAIEELTIGVDKLKDEIVRTTRDAERWKSKCEAAGISAPAEELSIEESRPR